MGKLVKEGLMLIILILLIPTSTALSIKCGLSSPPSSDSVTVTVGGTYYIMVEENTAIAVGYGTSPGNAVMQENTNSYIFQVNAQDYETSISYLALAKDADQNWITDSSKKCDVTVTCDSTSNIAPSVSISADPDSVSEGGSTTITVRGTDQEESKGSDLYN